MCLTKSFRCSHVILTMFLYFDYYTGNPVLVIVPMACVTVHFRSLGGWCDDMLAVDGWCIELKTGGG